MRLITATVVAVVFGTSAVHAASPGQRCQTAKNKVAGKYAYCRQKAEAKFATTGDAPARTLALQKCIYKYDAKWTGLEQQAVDAGGVCPSVGDQADIQAAIEDHTGNIAGALAGGALSDCPEDLATCNVDLGACNGDLGECNTDLSACGFDLTSCNSDLGTCTTDLGTCNNDLGTCDSDLTICQATPKGQRLKTDQFACYDSGGSNVACAGTGQDGELQKGLARAYVDNGDGTITDTKTGLMWEKLSDDGSTHDWDTSYSWANAVAVKIAALNGGGGFAGYTDWRLPNMNELQSLTNYGTMNPAVSAAFNTGCAPACTVLTCSCTQSTFYWSSSTYLPGTSGAWGMYFDAGTVTAVFKFNSGYVRAVRGGS